MELTKESINETLGPPTDISNLESSAAISKASFCLYKETMMITVLSSNIHGSYASEEYVLSRNQAIGVGLIIRITKFMVSVLALLCDRTREHGEVILALNRCITESAVKLIFFCDKASQDDIDQFIRSSLKPEKEAHSLIQNKINKRGYSLPIEKRMLKSIDKKFSDSGVKKTEPLPRNKDYKSILTAIGMESTYPFLQGIASHAIHGNWVDLLAHNLEKTEDGFKPSLDPLTTDARLLVPINTIVLTAIRSYVSKHFPNYNEGISTLINKIDNLEERNLKVDNSHEEKIS